MHKSGHSPKKRHSHQHICCCCSTHMCVHEHMPSLTHPPLPLRYLTPVLPTLPPPPPVLPSSPAHSPAVPDNIVQRKVPQPTHAAQRQLCPRA